jgi:hypothetical protein
VSSTARVAARKSRSNRTSAITIAIWFVAIVAVAGVAGQHMLRAGSPPAQAPAPAAAVEPTTSIIVSTPNSDECRRYRMAIDRGEVRDQGLGECATSSGDQGTRVETISKGFRNR